MRRVCGQAGQTAVEYLGMVLVVAVIVGALASAGVAGRFKDEAVRQVCIVLNGDGPQCALAERVAKAPRPRDSDGDRISDRRERRLGTLPGKADSDSDGLTDPQELRRGTDPRQPDSDGDGLSDGREVRLSADSVIAHHFDPLRSDRDHDGLNDSQELAARTMPDESDGDMNGEAATDGLSDYDEIFVYGTDPTVIDTDGDGASDGNEVREHTNPLVDERSLGHKVATTVTDDILDNPFDFIGGGGGVVVKKLAKRLPALGKLRRLLQHGKSSEQAADKAQTGLQKAAQRRAAVNKAARGGRGPTRVAGPTATPHDVLQPGGALIGRVGGRAGIREVRGGPSEAERLFERLAEGGKDITPPGHQGRLVRLPGGRGVVGLRLRSKSGPPTMDVNIPGVAIDKIKFVP